MQILEGVLAKRAEENKVERRVLQTASEQADRFQEQARMQKEAIDRLQRQVEWLLNVLETQVGMAARTEFWAKVESGEFG